MAQALKIFWVRHWFNHLSYLILLPQAQSHIYLILIHQFNSSFLVMCLYNMQIIPIDFWHMRWWLIQYWRFNIAPKCHL